LYGIGKSSSQVLAAGPSSYSSDLPMPHAADLCTNATRNHQRLGPISSTDWGASGGTPAVNKAGGDNKGIDREDDLSKFRLELALLAGFRSTNSSKLIIPASGPEGPPIARTMRPLCAPLRSTLRTRRSNLLLTPAA